MAGINIYQVVTDRIIEQLEKGTVPWRKPWVSVTKGAHNALSGHTYSLLNQLLLPKDGEWASYQQWLRVGGQVRQGEKSSLVVFFKWPDESDPILEEDASTMQNPKIRRPILKYYHVFHVSQVDGVEPLAPAGVAETHIEPVAKAEKLLGSYLQREQITLDTEYSDKACYSPSTDTIHMPRMNQFLNAAGYYSTAFHEAAHSTGHETRLNRKGIKNPHFGSETYSREELIAELAAASIMNSLGIETEDSFQNSAAYIDGWLDVLKRDKRFVVSAAGQAEKAVRYITGEMPMHDTDHHSVSCEKLSGTDRTGNIPGYHRIKTDIIPV